MKRTAIIVAFVLALSTTAFAGAKSYQVTGPVIAVTDDVVTVQKDKEKWEINYDKAKMQPKLGDKVLIKYEMKAVSMEVKSAAKAADDKKSAAKADDKKGAAKADAKKKK